MYNTGFLTDTLVAFDLTDRCHKGSREVDACDDWDVVVPRQWVRRSIVHISIELLMDVFAAAVAVAAPAVVKPVARPFVCLPS